ncbi:MAG: hypothetical protein L0027_01080 [Candidatus Rokubacteria bacterium]|nr:hypothetical protein [Candidatus Rokubacteria bacterium]
MNQSALDPASPDAEAILDLTVVLVGVGGLVFAIVIGLLLLAVAREPRPVQTALWVVGGGIVFPAVVLSALLLHSAGPSHVLTASPPAGALRIEVTG